MAISENQTIVLKSYFPSHRGRCHRLHALHNGCAKSALFALDKDHNCILTFAEVIEMYVTVLVTGTVGLAAQILLNLFTHLIIDAN